MNRDLPTPKLFWSRLGGQLGVGLCAVGFLLVFLGWNGAASLDRLPSQFPYLISGGIAGLCFVVLGVGMLVVQNQRRDRAALQATLRELQESLERAGLAQRTGEERTAFVKPGPRPVADATGLTTGSDPELGLEGAPAGRARPLQGTTAPPSAAAKAAKKPAKKADKKTAPSRPAKRA